MKLCDLQLPATEDTPEINFRADGALLSIKGRSLPENAYNFYGPLIGWVREYCTIYNQPTRIEFDLDYFNSSSGRYLFEILTIIELEARNRQNYMVIWKAEKEDELMIEKGEELRSLLDLPFEIEIY
jgi:hypothetical protein